MTEEINAAQEEFVFVPLFKNEYDNAWKKLISYKPWYVKKDSNEVWTFPVGLGDFDEVEEGDFKKKEYHHKFWLSVAVNEANKEGEKSDLLITLNEIDTKDYKKIWLIKKSYEGKVSYSAEAPVEVGGWRYWVSLTKNTKEDKKHDLNLTFKEAKWGTITWSTKEVSFDDMDF